MMRRACTKMIGAVALLAAAAGGSPLLASAAHAQTAKGTAASPAKPAGPVSADPAATSATYGDWVLRCQKVGEADKAVRVCEVAQTIQVQGQDKPIAQIAFGRIAATDPLKLTVALPTNISLPSAVTVALGDKDPVPMELSWRRCLPGACIADTVPSAEALKGLRTAGEQGRMSFRDAGGRDIAFPISFRGLAQALDALAKA